MQKRKIPFKPRWTLISALSAMENAFKILVSS